MAADPQDAPRHAGQVVRRVLLRRNIAIDAEDSAACRQRRPGGTPARRALPATMPTPARPRRRQRAAGMTRHRRRDGQESRHAWL